jgi:hypothetical protein
MHDYQYVTQFPKYDIVQRIKPEYAILYDSYIWGAETATLKRGDKSVDYLFGDIRDRIEALCKDHGQLVKSIDGGIYGDLEIYQIDWELK